MNPLKEAERYLRNLGYELLEYYSDKKGYHIGRWVSHNNRGYLLLAAGNFNYVKGIGICKSIDRWGTISARNTKKELLIYIQKYRSCYLLLSEAVYQHGEKGEIEKFAKHKGIGHEEREKYHNVAFNIIGAKNIRSDSSRQMNEGEKFWQPKLKRMGFIYTGDQHGDIVYTDGLGWCPDFIHPFLSMIIEEGKHEKTEIERRRRLAQLKRVEVYFIPYDVNFYKSHPEAVNGVLNTIDGILYKLERR